MKNINNVSNTMICRLKNIKNINTLHSRQKIEEIVNVICTYNRFNVVSSINATHRDFEYSMLYLLDDCHFSIKTFPETNSLIFHLIFHKNYDHNICCQINDFLCQALNADKVLSSIDFDDITTI